MLRVIIMMLSAIFILCAVAEAKPLVGVYYFPGWYRQGPADWKKVDSKFVDWSEWRGAVMKGAIPRPLAGFYDDANPKLWNYYNRWMSSHGIDFIAFDWYYNDGQDYLEQSLDSGYLGSNPDPDLKFCLHWCNHGGSWWEKPLDQSADKLLTMIDMVCDRYFKHPNYLRIDGKPVFMIYEHNTLSGYGDVKSNLEAMRNRAKQRGVPDLYIVGVYSGVDRSQIDLRKEAGYDAFCAYTYAWMRGPKVTWDSKTYDYPDITENVVTNVYPYLARVARADGIAYWPSSFSGWDDRPRAGLERAIVLVGNTPDQFGKMFKNSLRYVDRKNPVVIIEAWNEWGEGANMEPSKQYGFGYLTEIAKALNIKNPDQSVPTKKEIASWSILTPEELKIAKENESKPWPVKPVKQYNMGANRKVWDVAMPVIINFASGGVEFNMHQIEIEKRDSEGLVFTTTGTDPQIDFHTPEIPNNQVGRVTVEIEVLEGVSGTRPVSPEIFVGTALLPEFCPFTSIVMPPITNGNSTQSTSQMMAWSAFGTPVIRMRIDPCEMSGVKFRLKRMIISGD